MSETASISPSEISLSSPHSKAQLRFRLSCFYFGQGLVFASWASRIPLIKESLKLSDAALGSILLSLPIAQLLFMAVSGRLVTTYGSKKILVSATPFYALCLLMVAFANQGWQLAIGLFIFGIIGNLSNISLNTHGVLTEKYYGKAINTSFHGSWSLGLFTGAMIGLATINREIPMLYHYIGIIAIAWLHISINKNYLLDGALTKKVEEKKKLFVKPEGVLVQLGLVAFCSMAAEGAMMDWSGIYFDKVVHAPENLVVLGYTTYAFFMTTGRFMGDRLIMSFGRKRVLQLSGALIFAGLLIAVLFPKIFTTCIGFMLVGLGVATIVPTTYSLSGNNKKVPPGVALAMVSGVGYLGFLMGPPLIGYISELFSLRTSFAVVASFGIIIAIIVSKIKAIE